MGSDSPTLDATFVQEVGHWDEICKLNAFDPYLQRIGLLVTTNPGKPYEWRNGLICFQNWVVIPPSSPPICTLLHEQ